MIVLDRTSKIIQVVLAGSVSTNEAQCYCVYHDVTAQTKDGTQEYMRASTEQDTNGTTAVTTVPAPTTANTSRVIDYLSVHNYDTASVTVTVQVYNSTGTATSRLMKVALAAGETLVYELEGGWQVL